MLPPALRWAALLLVGLLVASRIAAVFSVGANWDEFALLDRADETLETGQPKTGGRPGLSVLLLLPFVADCQDEIQVVRRARVLWVAITLAFVAGLGALLYQLQPESDRRARDALMGMGLLALVPAFLEWSIQIRSDQLAMLGGVWGGAALLASRRRPALALAAGLLLGLGFLSSQKLAYVAGLVGLLAAGQLVLAREISLRREALRVLLCAAAFGAALAAFGELVSVLFEVPEKHISQKLVSQVQIARSLSLFDYYRRTIGYSQYVEMLPTLAPHLALLAGLVAASLRAGRTSGPDRDRLVLAWLVLFSGVAVATFHAGAFAYFWITLGLFPAVAFTLAREPILRLVADARLRHGLVTAWWLALLAPGMLQAGFMLADSQRVQRESFAFVHRNLGRDVAGFHPERGLFCQDGGPPIQIHFSQTIYRRFGGRWREANSEKMIRTFREQPVEFILQSFRLNQFPAEVREFWAENYQPYRGSVFLAGRELAGSTGARDDFEVIVRGRYRWLPYEGAQSIEIAGHDTRAGASLSLDPGQHNVRFRDETAGMLVLAVNDPPSDAPRRFYKIY